MMTEVRPGRQAEVDLMTEVRPGRQAEVDLMTEAMKAEVDWMNPKIDDPREGRSLRTARKRWMLWPLDSELEAKGGWAEPQCRRKMGQKEESSTTLLEKVRLPILLEVFGKRLKLV